MAEIFDDNKMNKQIILVDAILMRKMTNVMNMKAAINID